MTRWLRTVWPPEAVLAGAACVFLAFQGLFLFMEWNLRRSPFTFDDESVLVTSKVLAGAYAVLYAAYRVWRFHPALRPGYRDWLNGTPWTSAKPLPMGPIHLVWQDAILAVIVVGVNIPRLNDQAIFAFDLFAFAYLIFLSGVNYLTGERLWAYAGVYGVGCMGIAYGTPVVFYPLAVATYACAYAGLQASLARFPWQDVAAIEPFLKSPGARQPGRPGESLGWPYDWLGPHTKDVLGLGSRDVFLMGLLAGWWLFVVNYRSRGNPDFGHGLLIYLASLGIGIVVRLLAYCMSYSSPLTLWGRLMLGRLIIPGYDKVFIAPLLALLVGVVAMFALIGAGFQYLPDWFGLEREVISPVALTVTFWILLGVGPSLQTWRLTGNHHITPTFSPQRHTR